MGPQGIDAAALALQLGLCYQQSTDLSGPPSNKSPGTFSSHQIGIDRLKLAAHLQRWCIICSQSLDIAIFFVTSPHVFHLPATVSVHHPSLAKTRDLGVVNRSGGRCCAFGRLYVSIRCFNKQTNQPTSQPADQPTNGMDIIGHCHFWSTHI